MKMKASINTNKSCKNKNIISNLDNAVHLILEAIKVCIIPPQYPLTIRKIQ